MLDISLEASGAVLIEGAKWCGKTRTAKEKASSVLLMQDPDYTSSYLKAADTKPSLLLMGDTPRLIDEWQMAPVLWDAVRFAVDQRGESGQFILTGSAVPKDNAVQHTGTGRISRMLMRPMSLFESLESNGAVSLKALFDGTADGECFSSLTIERLAYALTCGGWPASVGQKESVALRRVYDYVDAVINIDVSRVDDVEKSPARVRALMRSLARNVSSMSTIATIRNDIAGDEETISEKTISTYINALRRIFVVEDLPAWNPAMRSKTAIRTSPKRHFTDPSIATAVLRATPDSLLNDFNLRFFHGDIAEMSVLEAFVDTFDRPVNFLINNACLSRKGLLSGCSYEDFEYVQRVGVTAPYYLTRLLLDQMLLADGASIVNIASARTFQSQPDTESYSAAKGGIVALTHAMAVSLSGKARVNCISPGWIDTTNSPRFSASDRLQHPAGRVGRPADISNMVLYLCSDNAGFITSENITIDGGMSRLMIYHDDCGWKYEPQGETK